MRQIRSGFIVTIFALITLQGLTLAQTGFGDRNREIIYKYIPGVTKFSDNIKTPFVFASLSQHVSTNSIIIDKNYSINTIGRSPSMYITRQLISSADVIKPLNIVLKTSEDKKDESTKENQSFFRSDLFYFIGAAALATTFYIVWSDNDNTVAKKTFGTPPKP